MGRSVETMHICQIYPKILTILPLKVFLCQLYVVQKPLNQFATTCLNMGLNPPPLLNNIKKLHSWCGKASLSNQLSGLLVPCYCKLEHEQFLVEYLRNPKQCQELSFGVLLVVHLFSLWSNWHLTNLQRVEVWYPFNTCHLIDFNLLRLRSNPL